MDEKLFMHGLRASQAVRLYDQSREDKKIAKQPIVYRSLGHKGESYTWFSTTKWIKVDQNGSWAFNSEFRYSINHQGNGPSDFISWHENRFFVYIPDARVPQAWNDSAEGDSFPQTSLNQAPCEYHSVEIQTLPKWTKILQPFSNYYFKSS